MSVTTPAPVTFASAAGSRRDRWRRARPVVAVGVVVLLAALLLAVTVPRGGGSDPYDPGNPAPSGARALARVLAAQSVDVRRVTRSSDAVARTGPGDTLLVTVPQLLDPRQLDRLAADDAGRIVLLRPDQVVLDRLAPQLRAAGRADPRTAGPGCDLPDARSAGTALAGGYQYGASGNGGGSATICYPGTAEAGTGAYALARTGARQVVVLGRPELLTNDEIGRSGNAALALRTLGPAGTLVWYLPDPLEAGAPDDRPGVSDLVPGWVVWAAAQLGLAVALALLWRARRLGPLVPEPLPVLVRAGETQQGRARLYRQAHARGRAAGALRSAAARRLAARLAAPDGTTGPQLVALVVAATGLPGQDVQAALLGPDPATDADLVRLAQRLDDLERRAAPGATDRPRGENRS